jgi:Putative DnaT-like ssDNA binding protein
LSLITSIGGPESNSYVSLSWAETYLATLFGTLSDEWTTLSTEMREYRLEMGAALIGWLPLRGHRVYKQQSLSFPRSCQTDVTVIPENVKNAQALLAYEVAHLAVNAETSLTDNGISQDGASVRFIGLGALQVTLGSEITAQGGGLLLAFIRSGYPQIYLMVMPFCSSIRAHRIRTEEERAADYDDLLDYEDLITTTTT